MGGVNHLTIPAAILVAAFLHADFADGHTVSLPSTHGHLRSDNPLSWVQKTSVRLNQTASEDPLLDVEDHAEQVVESAEKQEYERQYEGGDISQVEQKYPIIYSVHRRLDFIFGKHFEERYKDWKLWVGLALWMTIWAKWLGHGYDEVYWERGFYAFGLNILILHLLQYASTVRMGMASQVVPILMAQALLQNALWFNEKKDESTGPTPRPGEKFVADTLYLDLALPGFQITILFISQFCVWWFYMTSIIGNFNFEHVNYTFWLVAFACMQMTMILCRGGDSVLGNPFPIHDVWMLITHADKVNFVLESDDDDQKPFAVAKFDIVLRGLSGFFCNAILREIMSYTIPLLLMGFSEPMDFVVYCVGVNFICTIDDMSERSYVIQDRVDEAQGTTS